VQQLGDDALLQVYPRGIRHILADKRVNEWKAPPGQTIIACTTNKRQVVVALSTHEIIYFELDLEGQLNEYQDRKDMGVDVITMSVAEVPEGRQRTPYLVRPLSRGLQHGTDQLIQRPSVALIQPFASSRSTRIRPSRQ
jgi:splicing factor 3B subunit 3